MRPHRCFRSALVKRQYFPRRLFSDSPQNQEIQPSSFMRCRAGKSEPSLTTKVPPMICWILREISNSCIPPAISEFEISRSTVPCKRAVGSGFKDASPIAALWEQYRFTYRVSIGSGHLSGRDLQALQLLPHTQSAPKIRAGRSCGIPQQFRQLIRHL
jgi:hypothetical protein